MGFLQSQWARQRAFLLIIWFPRSLCLLEMLPITLDLSNLKMLTLCHPTPPWKVPLQHNPGPMLGVYQCLEVDLFHNHILSLGAMLELAQVLYLYLVIPTVIVLVRAWVSYLHPTIYLENLFLCQEEICLEATHTIVIINNHNFNLSSLGPKS